jgi:hypothetical protein
MSVLREFLNLVETDFYYFLIRRRDRKPGLFAFGDHSTIVLAWFLKSYKGKLSIYRSINFINMKKIVCTVLLVMTAFSLLHAQETHFGLKAGVNISSATVDPGDNYGSKVGFHGGGLAHIHISRSFAIQPEVVFSMQGGERKDEAKFKFNYINIPVLAQYMTQNGFRLQTGPQLGILTSARRVERGGDVERNVKENMKNIDFAWVFGAGFLFPGGVGIDARYNLGLTDIWETSTEVKNSVFQLGLFYQFMHGKAHRK